MKLAQLVQKACWLGAIVVIVFSSRSPACSQTSNPGLTDTFSDSSLASASLPSVTESYFEQASDDAFGFGEIGFASVIESSSIDDVAAIKQVEFESTSATPAVPVAASRPEFPEAKPLSPDKYVLANPTDSIESIVRLAPEPATEFVAPSDACGCESQLRGRTRIGRFLNGVYQGVCNPDPCYVGQWNMLANASLFTESLRPQNRQRLRWDFSNDYRFPDRAEYLWGQSGATGPGFENSIDYHELSYYLETGGDKFSFFVNTPYRSNYLESGGHTAGFADLSTGTKTLLHDTHLLQIALQFETHIPSGNPLEGLGTRHVSLEPALLVGVQLSPVSYLQTAISQWIPIGGTPEFAGALSTYSASYNRTLWCGGEDTSLIGTMEYSGVSFQAGGVTTSPGTTISTNDVNFGLLGGGLRLNICNKFNIGFASQIGLNDDSPAAVYRTEIQFRH